jgi:hypothetical protein
MRSAYLSHMIAATTQPDKYWQLQVYDCRNTLIYEHKTALIVPNFDISLVSLKLPLHEAGDFVKLRLLYFSFTVAACVADRV